MSSVAAIITTAKDIPSTDFFNTHACLQRCLRDATRSLDLKSRSPVTIASRRTQSPVLKCSSEITRRQIYAPKKDCSQSDGIFLSGIGIGSWRRQGQRNDHFSNRRNVDRE